MSGCKRLVKDGKDMFQRLCATKEKPTNPSAIFFPEFRLYRFPLGLNAVTYCH